MVPCPLCRLGFTPPHGERDWNVAMGILHRSWLPCDHGIARVLCESCHRTYK